ncbi:leucine-rich repeat-containing protein kinase family protein [Chitinilyticum aquatile]|uniref:leucine-rich repeat-containing protein kinase family protein n=1 Tax=Chitinilyticum aquatile TaxID=362520 RepID=UPI000422668C|nr:leucine-rich repeat-containing protein kinase family protein [Chitinilyticum aquatile]
MHTLEQLQRGALRGITRLDLAADLAEFPAEIFTLADSLEVLNLSGNRLDSLPDELPRLTRLKVIFCSDNRFTTLPAVLGRCPQLEMIGFKANAISHIPDDALPPRLRWLTLTDNAITALPETIGDCPRLAKLLLAGNRLESLPGALQHCRKLALLRIAANQFSTLPDWLAAMPELAWLAFAGNPLTADAEARAEALSHAATVNPAEVTAGDVLGRGASGLIRAGLWLRDGVSQAVAIKQFHSGVTSDGLPHCELLANWAAGRHPNLIGVHARLGSGLASTPALLLERIAPHYRMLAAPPSLESCTRDEYDETVAFSPAVLLAIAHGIAAALAQIHANGLLHGDLYAHNILLDDRGHALLGDFGAATLLPGDPAQQQRLQALDVRAFGLLLGELCERCATLPELPVLAGMLAQLQQDCSSTTPARRPAMAAVVRILTTGLQQIQ